MSGRRRPVGAAPACAGAGGGAAASAGHSGAGVAGLRLAAPAAQRLAALQRVAAALLVVLWLPAGCGGVAPVPRSAPAPAVRTAGAVTVRAGPTPLGTVLVDGAGITLYRYSGDARGVSRCGARCLAQGWTPLAPGSRSAVAGTGVSAAQLGVIARAGGGRQVTYRGWPLYTFAEDRVAGEAAGQGLRGPRGVWTVVRLGGGPAAPAHAQGSSR